MAARTKIYFDGGCRPNPGTMELAVVVRGVAHIEREIGRGTGMDAEWLALIAAVRMAQSIGARDYVLLGDAAAVIDQATGRTRCAPTFAHHLNNFRALTASATPRIRFIKRTQNLAGIALSRVPLRGQLPSTTKISPS